MELDLFHHLGASARAVTRREHQGRPARVVVATRAYNTDVDDLWDALTTAERIPRWFLPVSGELRLGGRYQLEGNAGGEVIACEPPRRLGVTWEMQGEASWVTVTLSPAAEGWTTLTLEHVAIVPEEFWSQYGPGAVGVGWELGLLGLALYLGAKDAPFDKAAVQAWTMSPNGQAFARGAAKAWGEAAIAAGDEAEAAEAAAARTAVFYTGGQ
ncbi:SRPBCC family protein [Myxococcota bacterium]|nr:SRPBCC family protein [Myxococcota bacterium]